MTEKKNISAVDSWHVNRRDIAEVRRSRVAMLLKRGLTQVEITEALAKPGEGQIVNPDTGEPFGHATIHRDVVELRERWRADIAQDIGDHFAEQVAKLTELEKTAWSQNELRLVLDILKEKSKLFGLYSPVKVEIDWRTEVVQLLIEGRIDRQMLEDEIDEPEILEGIFTEARLFGYEERSNEEENSTEDRSGSPTDSIEIQPI